MGLLSEILSNSEAGAGPLLERIEAHEREFPDDCMLDMAKALVAFFDRSYETAEGWIQSAIEKNPANHMNHFYYALIASANGAYFKAACECLVAANFATQFGQPPDWEEYAKQLNALLGEVTAQLSEAEAARLTRLQNVLRSPGSFFPAYYLTAQDRWSIFQGEFLYFDPEESYNDYVCVWPQSHNDLFSYTMAQLLAQSGQYNAYAIAPMESWKAARVREYASDEGECVFAVAATAPEQRIQIKAPGEPRAELNLQVPNLFHYLRMDQRVTLSSQQDFILSRPVPLGQRPSAPKLVLCIFLDGLSQHYLQETGYAYMPHTKEFFQKGTIFQNCYATAEWTHPSVASLCTGLYAARHQIIYRSSAYQFPPQVKTASEIFSDGGYFTASISGSVGTSPYIGGLRGFDHAIYKSCLGFPDSHLIDDALDHLEAFSDTSQYMFLGLFDIHKSKEDSTGFALNFDLAQQTAVDYRIAASKTPDRELKSVRKHYHEPTIYKYQAAMRQNDRQLKEIYDYIRSHYEEDEYIVCLFSDHGVPFVDQEEFLLKANQTNSVLMLRGSGVPAVESEEYVNHIDYLPAIARLAGISFDFSGHDCVLPRVFGGPGRDYAYTESIYQGQGYEAAVRDGQFEYRFETRGKTGIDGRVDLSRGYTEVLLDAETGEEVHDEELTRIFASIIFEHIKGIVKY